MKKKYICFFSLLIIFSLLLSMSMSVFAAGNTAPPGEGTEVPGATESTDTTQPSETPELPDNPDTPEVPADTVPPVIQHQSIANGKLGQALSFQATATDDISVAEVRLLYRAAGTEEWTQILMTAGECNAYTALLEAELVTMDTLEYYLEASDGTNVSATPIHQVLMDKGLSISGFSATTISITEAALAPITVTGEGFTEGMTITVGGVEAAYTLVSETELSLQPPVLTIGKADVVISSGENQCTRLEAITYQDPDSYVRVTASEKVYIGQKVGFPITVGSSASVTEVFMQIRLNTAYFENIQFILEDNPDVFASCDISKDGIITVRVTSSTPLSSMASIGYVTASVPYVEKDATTFITIQSASFHGVDVKAFECPVVVSNQISVSLKDMPETIYALEGMIPEFSGWNLEIDYEGLKQIIPVTQEMISISQETPGSGKVTYFHKEVPITFQVLEKEKTTITVKTPPAKLQYIVGQPLDLTGLELELSYGEGTVVIPVQNYTVSGFDPYAQGVQTLTIAYGDILNTLEVTVFVKGDVNQDARITILDMVTVKSHVLKLSELTELSALAADYNGDGKITLLDYVQIKAFILGIDTESDKES